MKIIQCVVYPHFGIWCRGGKWWICCTIRIRGFYKRWWYGKVHNAIQ